MSERVVASLFALLCDRYLIREVFSVRLIKVLESEAFSLSKLLNLATCVYLGKLIGQVLLGLDLQLFSVARLCLVVGSLSGRRDGIWWRVATCQLRSPLFRSPG